MTHERDEYAARRRVHNFGGRQMKRVQLAAVMLVMTVVSGNAFAQAAWKDVKPPACQVTVKMPGEPKEQKQEFDTPEVGKVVAYMYIWEGDAGTRAFLLGCNDYPADKVKNADKQKMLDGAKMGAVTNVKGKLVAEKKIEVNGHPGLQIEVEAGPNKVFARIIIVRNRLIQLLVVEPANKVKAADVDTFFKSLSIQYK
jgi:hypothetical protein